MSYATAARATYRSRLTTLNGLLAKAEAHEEGDAVLQARLTDDMHPLATQIRFVTNIPGEALQRLGVLSFSSSDAELGSFAEAKALVAQTAALLEGVSADALPPHDQRIEFAIGGGAYNFAMSAEEYVREFSLPNFYFHLSMTYAILRMKGLAIGKADFIPHMFQYMRQPAG